MSAVLLTGKVNSYAQFITVLVIFIAVLGLTALTTRWISNYQKQQNVNCNIEVLETIRISSNKYIQLVRIGEAYKAIAVCKDSVTLLGDVPEEQLKDNGRQNGSKSQSFRELFDKAIRPKE